MNLSSNGVVVQKLCTECKDWFRVVQSNYGYRITGKLINYALKAFENGGYYYIFATIFLSMYWEFHLYLIFTHTHTHTVE